MPAALAALMAVGGITPVTLAPVAAQADDGTAVTISSEALNVSVDRTFPQVVSYTDVASGNVMQGNEDHLTEVVINGITYTPTITSEVSAHRVDYVMTFPGYGGITINASLKVHGSEVDFTITKIADTTSNPVDTLSIPHHNLVSIRSTDSGGAFAGTRMNGDNAPTEDRFNELDASTSADSAPNGWLYGIINNDQLAASITTNSEYDDPKGPTADENSRIMKQVVAKDGYNRLGLWSGDWLRHPRDVAFDKPEPLPSVKVVITGDRNGDKAVDWQDGAVAFRDIMPNPRGWQNVSQQPVQRIPFNFASTATHPFLQTLDETKRIALNTDGLGQFVLLKGYANEGHDSGHPDYAGVGAKQGGVKDLNTLANNAGRFNANIGVHLQGNEEYPASPAFDPKLANDVTTDRGWDWLDQSYHMNKRYDGASGRRLARLAELKKKVPKLGFLYVDSDPGDGYVGNEFAREINGLGLQIATENHNRFESSTTWSHWGNESGTSFVNSQIARFIRNQQRDTWGNDPLLGKNILPKLEGWHNGTDYSAFIKTVFANNLPVKYLQGFPIMKRTADTVTFTHGVSVSNASGKRQITKDGHLILDGGSYLLPWSQNAETKLYHWNPAGGSTQWTLPAGWGTQSSVKLYKLTDTGRKFVRDIEVTDRKIDIEADANTPYVVYKSDPGAVANPDFGQGTPLHNPSFEARDLSAWKIGGDTSKASVITDARGRKMLELSAGNGTTVSQKLTGLTGGKTYAATVHVQVPTGTRRTRMSVTPATGTAVSNYTDRSTFKNYDGASDYNDTTMQPMKVLFDVPAGQTTATLTLSADKGTVASRFAGVRVVETVRAPQGDHLYYNDFDHENGLMWGPFVYAGAGGGPGDGRTHLAPKNAPYTQAGWNGQQIDDVIDGQYSLKAHGEGGLVYRTLPQTLRFAPNRTYKVTFKYEADFDNEYAFVSPGGATKFAAAHTPTTFTTTFSANPDDNTWIGVQRVGSTGHGLTHDLVIDNIAVDDLGYTPTGTTRLPQSGLTVAHADSQGADTPATNVLDNHPDTYWSTASSGTTAPLPHEIQLDLGDNRNVSCLSYLPRQDQSEGRIAKYEVYTSTDGTTWGDPVTTGTWKDTTDEEHACFSPVTARYLRLRALSEVNGNPVTSAAELNVSVVPVRFDQSQMSVAYADSQELVGENAPATNVLDGDMGSFWHTQWSGTVAPMPHEIQLNLGGNHNVTCLRYLPRQNSSAGRIAKYEVYTSTDGTTWGNPVTTGTWPNSSDEQRVCFDPVNAHYIRLRALSEVNGHPWTSVAELNIDLAG